VIFAPNHPNQAVDPFLIGTISARPVHFLAKSGLFKNPILAKFFRALNMIPVYRASDNQDTSKNLSSFTEAIDLLLKGKALCIFPEGTSTEQRNLLPLKTGIARIAFDAAVKSNWEIDIKIQPISITYLSPRIFQSSVTLTIDSAISILEYQPFYNKDAKLAVQQLTNDLATRLNAITVSVPNLVLQQDIEHITNLFDDDNDLRTRMQEISSLSHLVSEKLPIETKLIQTKLNDLYQEGYSLGYFGVGSESLIKAKKNIFSHILVAIGAVVHYIPYTLTKVTTSIFVKDPHNLASIKIGAGVIFYTFWYFLIFTTLLFYFSTFTAILLLFLVMLLGDYSNRASEASSIFVRSLISRVINFNKLPYHIRHEQFLSNRESLKNKLLELSEIIRHDFH
jgi:1-acyl-sn-glycerol-3-phosphate acyltransferase